MGDRYANIYTDIHGPVKNRGPRRFDLDEPGIVNKELEFLLPRIKGLPDARGNVMLNTDSFQLRPPEGIGEEDLKQLKHLPKILDDIEQFVINQSVFP